MDKKKKRVVVKAWTVYSEMAETITKKIAMQEDAHQLWKDTVAEGKMPRESWEDAAKRYHSIPCTVTYYV